MIRVCVFCGEKDPHWHGIEGRGWTKTADGKDCCASCAWERSGPDAPDLPPRTP